MSNQPFSQNEISKAAWNVANALHGGSEPTEYKKVFLLSFFFKYISDVRKEFDQTSDPSLSPYVFDIPLGHSFDDVLTHLDQPDFHHVVGNAFYAIERANESRLGGILTVADFKSDQYFRGVFPRKLGEVFRILQSDRFDFRPSHTDAAIVAEAFWGFVETLFTHEGYKGGAGHTPHYLLSLISQLLNPQSGKSIYDPACGTAGLLIAAHMQSIKQGDGGGLRIFGQDIDAFSVAISKIGMILNQVGSSEIYMGNTLLHPGNVSGGELQKFDYAVSSPPFASRITTDMGPMLEADGLRRFEFGIPNRSTEYLFLQHMLASLNENGRAIMIAPSGMLFVSGREGDIRKQFIENDLVEAIIGLPPALLRSALIPTNLFIINKAKAGDKRGKVLFINAAQEYERSDRRGNALSEENQRKILEAYQNYADVDAFSQVVDVETIRHQNYNLLPARYLEAAQKKKFFGGKVTWMPMSDLAEIHRSSVSVSRDADGETVSIIRTADLSNKRLNIDDLEKVHISRGTQIIYAQVGDILFSHLGSAGRALAVDESLNGVLVGNHISVIRLKPDSVHLRQYLLEFLRSDKGYGLISNLFVGAVMPHLRPSDFLRLDIPIPDNSVTELIANIQNVEMDLLQRIETAQGLRARLFGIEDAEGLQKQLDELGTETKILTASLVQADSRDYKIRNFYPYPLAFAYRSLSAIHDTVQKYKAQLRIAENLLVFLASIGLSIAQLNGGLKNQTDITGETIRGYFNGGISPGDWQSLAYFAGKTLRGQRQLAIADSFAALWFKGSGMKETTFAKNTKRLVTLKNDFKHDRSPDTPQEVKDISKELQELIDSCYDQLSFMVKYPIRLVQSMDIDFITNEAVLETLVYEGDHPGLRREQIRHPKPLTKDVLYLEVDKDLWSPIYPLVSVQYCQSCKMQETYFIDNWDSNANTSLLKSFERGHTHNKTLDAKQVASNFEHWINTNLT